MVVPNQSYLFTIDIDSLYTNINTQIGIKAIKSIFNNNPDNNRPDKEIIQLLTTCLNNNDFSFNNKQFLQIHGTAMGQRYAPSYANIYMSEWEREALAKCTHKPLTYLRFLDDIFCIWQHDISLFSDFIDTLNSHHPSIKVKYIIDPLQIHFLDTTVFFDRSNNLSYSQLLTKVYFKTTDTHALLHKTSYHPKHTFKDIIKSQIIRFYRISSLAIDLHSSISILFCSLRQRGYSKRFLRQIKNSTLASLAPTRFIPHIAPPRVPVSEGTPPTGPLPVYPIHYPKPDPNLNPNPNPNQDPPRPNPNPNSPNPNPDPNAYPNPNQPFPKPNPNPNSPNPNPDPNPYPNPNQPSPKPNPNPNSPNPNPPNANPDPNPNPNPPETAIILRPNNPDLNPVIIPFISTFSHRITGLHNIKQNFALIQTVQNSRIILPYLHTGKTKTFIAY